MQRDGGQEGGPLQDVKHRDQDLVRDRHGRRNKLLALWADQGQIEGRGPDHLTADCVITGSDNIGPSSGNCTYAEWLVLVSQNKQGSKYPSADGWRVVRCDNVGVGDSESGMGVPSLIQTPQGTQVWHCSGTIRTYHGATVAASDVHAGDPPDVPPRGDSGAVRWSPSQVGPNARWDPTDGGT